MSPALTAIAAAARTAHACRANGQTKRAHTIAELAARQLAEISPNAPNVDSADYWTIARTIAAIEADAEPAPVQPQLFAADGQLTLGV